MKSPHPFDAPMFEIYHRAKTEAGYNANLFYKMLNDLKGVATAKKLINAAKPSDGYTKLFELGRLDLTVEAMVVRETKWHSLFEPEEIEKAKNRLREYHYKGLD